MPALEIAKRAADLEPEVVEMRQRHDRDGLIQCWQRRGHDGIQRDDFGRGTRLDPVQDAVEQAARPLHDLRVGVVQRLGQLLFRRGPNLRKNLHRLLAHREPLVAELPDRGLDIRVGRRRRDGRASEEQQRGGESANIPVHGRAPHGGR